MSKKIFMGGICGMGMAPLALFLRAQGNCVSGFDDSENPHVRGLLESQGIELTKNRAPDSRADVFIISSALAKNAASLKKDTSKKFLRRGEMLAEICDSRRLLAVCGSHGKTTTSALIAHAINNQKLDAGYIVGALPADFSPSKYCEDGAILAAEIDESDATIENFSPQITLALNGDLDHTDTYADINSLRSMFERLFARTRGAVIIPEHDKTLNKAAKHASAKVVKVKIPEGDFLDYDKAMALAALNEAFGKNFAREIFDDFCGVERRQETIFNSEKICAVADYAHHPTEVRAFLDWLDNSRPQKKLIFFQPHRYTRTKRFAEDFKKIFLERANLGDEVFILPVYAASETRDESACSDKIADGKIGLCEFSEMEEIIKKRASQNVGQLCSAFVGAGDIYFEARKIKYEKV